jgi:8-oxo-dGTP diphosphatase
MRGDGDGWVTTSAGQRYWGRHGAAGLLLRAPTPDGRTAVLLQYRNQWSHHGGTWGIPGGARDSHETAEEAAIREAHEETGIDVRRIRVHSSVVTASPVGTAWTYTTVLADADTFLPTRRCVESTELRWVEVPAVTSLPLHPGFAASWSRLSGVLDPSH